MELRPIMYVPDECAEREVHPVYSRGLRWQFEVDSTAELDDIIEVCRTSARPRPVDASRRIPATAES